MLIVFWIVAALRFLAVYPFVIDDDEAWWSAASNAMHSPLDFYRSAVDHKPPGVVWFYWAVNHFIPCATDPRVVRAVYTALTISAAVVLGWAAREFYYRKHLESGTLQQQNSGQTAGWIAATLFLLVSGVPVPKILAVTADGLIVILVICAYTLALFFEFSGVALLSGMVLGFALLIKQTAVFFAIPIVFATWPKKWTWKQISYFALGSMLVVVPSIFAVGWQDFLYWNWTYPKQMLTTVREKLFHSNVEMFESLGIFIAATLPLVVLLVKKGWSKAYSAFDFRVLWLIAGVGAALLGKGLFLHYLLLFVPPFVLLATEAIINEMELGKSPGRHYFWLGVQYLAGAVLLIIPSSGIFWGTDLNYFEHLGHVMKKNLRADERVMIWGGSALPLTYTGAEHVTRFVLPRFGVAPYATAETSEMFRQEIQKDPPELLVDLHERGDNQFDNPIESEPALAALVSSYHVYVSPAVPWAKFYFKSVPADATGLVEVQAAQSQQAYAVFPREQKSWMTLMTAVRTLGLSKATDVDWALRARASLELLAEQGTSDQVRAAARALAEKLQPETATPEIRAQVEAFFSQGGFTPFPLRSLAWWPSLALVELQPRSKSR